MNQKIAERHMMLLCEGSLDVYTSKTATGVLIYCPDDVVAVIDRDNAGRTLKDAIGLDRDVPIISTVTEGIALGGNQLIIGVANTGGTLLPNFRGHIVEALKAGVAVVSGLHEMLDEDEEFVALAEASGAMIHELRRVPEAPCGSNLASKLYNQRILTVGSDCNVGKMCTSLELTRQAQERGLDASFAATGQTGILIAGSGYCIDRAISDFTSGIVEKLMLERAGHDYVFIEGQGSLDHAAYSGVTLSLLHGSAPQAMIMCHAYDRLGRRHDDGNVLLPLVELIEMHEMMSRPILPSKVVGVSIFTRGLDEQAARDELARVSDQTGLPTTDPVRFGAGVLLDAILEHAR